MKNSKSILKTISEARTVIKKMYPNYMVENKTQVPITKNIYGSYGFTFHNSGTLKIGDILNPGGPKASKVCYIISYKDFCYA